ncbi:3'-5' exonuclease [Glycomyces sp. L485]|uniref:3'-5' exonuclease n=1 Tax=Glycomyces sp. L485 TaxID=2909235 RepID=UPI001F4B5CD0|nr:3'-5' exonuclease [Glycomyces sp. L485]MCH7229700.1 3'-5' exonuclease [Glycomyces sp. L485]
MDSWVAIDFETANAHRASPCSVAMVRVTDGKVEEVFETLIKPPERYSWFEPRNVGIHGITESQVAGAPPWRKVWAQMSEFIDGSPLVAHNAAFDTGVIREANSADGLPWPELRYACTVVIARRTWKGLRSYTLPRIAELAGVSLSDHHRAEADARAAAGVLVAEQREHGVDTIGALLHTSRVAWGRISPDGWDGCRKR